MHCKKRLAIFPKLFPAPGRVCLGKSPLGTGKSLAFFYGVCSRTAFIVDGKDSWVLDVFLKKEKVGGTIRNHEFYNCPLCAVYSNENLLKNNAEGTL
jgi:hypothetical protein